MNRFVKTVTQKLCFDLGNGCLGRSDVMCLNSGAQCSFRGKFQKKVITHLGLLWFYWHGPSWSIDVKSPWAVSHVLGLAFETLSLWAWLSALLPRGWILSNEVENQKCSQCFSLTPTKTWGDTHLTTFYRTYCVFLRIPSVSSGSSAVMAQSCLTFAQWSLSHDKRSFNV